MSYLNFKMNNKLLVQSAINHATLEFNGVEYDVSEWEHFTEITCERHDSFIRVCVSNLHPGSIRGTGGRKHHAYILQLYRNYLDHKKQEDIQEIAQEQKQELDNGFAKLREEFAAKPKLHPDYVRAIQLIPLYIAVCENDLGEEEHVGLREMTYEESELIEKLMDKLHNLHMHVDQTIFN